MRRSAGRLAALAFTLGAAAAAAAAPIGFQIKTSSSSLSLSGTVRGPGDTLFPISPALSGSLTTAYSGTIFTDSNLAQIVFMGSSADAGVNGNYYPGPLPSDYGLKVTLPAPDGLTYGAIRDLTFSLSGAATPLSGGFNLGSVGVSLTGGNLMSDKLTMLPLAGASAVQVAGTGSLFSSAGVFTLRLPLTASFSQAIPNSDYTVDLTLSGVIIATRTAPEPGAACLLVVGAALAGVRRRAAR